MLRKRLHHFWKGMTMRTHPENVLQLAHRNKDARGSDKTRDHRMA